MSELISQENIRQIAIELAVGQKEINATTLPEILKNAQAIYEWLTK